MKIYGLLFIGKQMPWETFLSSAEKKQMMLEENEILFALCIRRPTRG